MSPGPTKDLPQGRTGHCWPQGPQASSVTAKTLWPLGEAGLAGGKQGLKGTLKQENFACGIPSQCGFGGSRVARGNSHGDGTIPLRIQKTSRTESLLCQASLLPPMGTRPEEGGGLHQSVPCGQPGHFSRRRLLPTGKLLQGLTQAKPGSQRWEAPQEGP